MRQNPSIRSAEHPSEAVAPGRARAELPLDSAHFWVDAEGHVERWSTAAGRLFGLEEGVAMGAHVDRILGSGAGSDLWTRIRACLQRHGRWEDVGWRPRANGTRVWARCVIDTCRSLEGEPVGWLVAIRLLTGDAGDGRPLDPAAFRLQSLGRAATGMAHDLNNILMAIECFAGLVDDGLPEGGEAKEIMRQLLGATRRGMRLSQDVLGVGGAPDTADSHVAECVRRMEPLLRALLPPRIRLTLDLAPDLPAVSARARDLELILLNLVANARDAIDGEGHIEISAEAMAAEGRAGGVELSVRDSGTGISGAVRDQLFDRYVTTKERDGGTGLGLSMVLDVVRTSSARLELHSSPGAGTCVGIIFPAETGASATGLMEGGAPTSRQRAGGRRIELHEELAMGVRRPLELLLSRRGFEVVVGRGHPGERDSADVRILRVDDGGMAAPLSGEGRARGGTVLRLVGRSAAGTATEELLPLPCAPSELAEAVERLLEGEHRAHTFGPH